MAKAAEDVNMTQKGFLSEMEGGSISHGGETLFLMPDGYVPSVEELPQSSSESNGIGLAKVSMAVLHQQNGIPLLSSLQLLGIIFFTVAGGPYGFEDAVGAGGPAIMFLFLFIVPILWSTPMALMTAELACMIPETGGHIFWTYRAFGPFWSFLNGVFTLACSVFDTALYPAMFVDYLGYLIYGGWKAVPTIWSICLKTSMVVAAVLINIRGVGIVGTASIFFLVAVLTPFVVLILWGLPRFSFAWVAVGIPKRVNWARLLTIILWNTSGFDAAGTCASEVKNPEKSYPVALGAGVAIMVAIYAIPSLLGVSVMPDAKLWHDGAYVQVASIVGGRGLGVLMGVAAMLSAMGLLVTRLCTNSRLVFGMARIGQVPRALGALHPHYATPWVAIIVTSACTLLLSGLSFTSLAEADMVFYALSTSLKFGALVQLRFTEPDAYRPFRIPIGDKWLAVLCAVPIGLCIAMVWIASQRSHLIAIIGLVAAIAGYVAQEGAPLGRLTLLQTIADLKTKFWSIYASVRSWGRPHDPDLGPTSKEDVEAHPPSSKKRFFPGLSFPGSKRIFLKYYEVQGASEKPQETEIREMAAHPQSGGQEKAEHEHPRAPLLRAN